MVEEAPLLIPPPAPRDDEGWECGLKREPRLVRRKADAPQKWSYMGGHGVRNRNLSRLEKRCCVGRGED